MTLSFTGDTVEYIDAQGNTREAFLTVMVPYQDLLSNNGGQFTRLRVDPAQTGFFDGREFRTFLELNMTDGQVIVIRAYVPIDVILFALATNIISGQLDVETMVGGTPGGSFSTALPIFNRNNMTIAPQPPRTSEVELYMGGTHTDGTRLDIIKNKAADNANFASSVGTGAMDERGVGPNTYYFRLIATGAVEGVFRAWWEERP